VSRFLLIFIILSNSYSDPLPASSVLDSIGVNLVTHDPAYYQNYHLVAGLLNELGIKHVRLPALGEDPRPQGSGPYNWHIALENYSRFLKSVSDSGVYINLIPEPSPGNWHKENTGQTNLLKPNDSQIEFFVNKVNVLKFGGAISAEGKTAYLEPASRIISIEMPNERDSYISLSDPVKASCQDGKTFGAVNRCDKYRIQNIRSYSEQLISSIKAHPKLRDLQILAPTLVWLKQINTPIENQREFGNIYRMPPNQDERVLDLELYGDTSALDYLRPMLERTDQMTHNHYCEYSNAIPGDTNDDRCRRWVNAHKEATSKPLTITETGYFTRAYPGPTPGVTPTPPPEYDRKSVLTEELQGIYLIASILDFIRDQAARIYIYKLMDGISGGGSERRRSYGLYHTDGRPKPAANLLKSFIQLINDEEDITKTQSPLNVSVSCNGCDPRFLEIQRKNGVRYVFVWKRLSSIPVFAEDPSKYAPITNEITLNLDRSMTVRHFYLGSSPGNEAPATSSAKGELTDIPLVFELTEVEEAPPTPTSTPSSSPTPTATPSDSDRRNFNNKESVKFISARCRALRCKFKIRSNYSRLSDFVQIKRGNNVQIRKLNRHKGFQARFSTQVRKTFILDFGAEFFKQSVQIKVQKNGKKRVKIKSLFY